MLRARTGLLRLEFLQLYGFYRVPLPHVKKQYDLLITLPHGHRPSGKALEDLSLNISRNLARLEDRMKESTAAVAMQKWSGECRSWWDAVPAMDQVRVFPKLG